MDKNVTFDLHYHSNIFRASPHKRRARLQQHIKFLSQNNVDHVASTEHAYKQPLDAFLYLQDAAKDLRTNIIPAVEAISSEGVDIIFLYACEDDLKNALKIIRPFEWNLDDMNKLRDDSGAINIIPHPFSPGKTGIANIMGIDYFMNLQKNADYVEIHNGLSLHFFDNGFRKYKNFKPSKLKKSVDHCFCLPKKYRLNDVGWAVSSDAHYPAHQNIIGSVKYDGKCDDWFGFLQQKQRFKRKSVAINPHKQVDKIWHLLQSGGCSMFEAIEKKALKLRQAIN